MSVRDNYVERFGEAQAAALEQAADMHKNGIHDKKGSDPFKWAVVIAIGYECVEKERYREYHGITVPFDEFGMWVKEHGELASHDGDCDYITLVLGKYNEYVKPDAVTADKGDDQ